MRQPASRSFGDHLNDIRNISDDRLAVVAEIAVALQHDFLHRLSGPWSGSAIR
jgi:hypothetical protein